MVSSRGMVAGAAGMVDYCVAVSALVKRFGALVGSVLAYLAWDCDRGGRVVAFRQMSTESPIPSLNLHGLKEKRLRDYTVRFGFGASIS